jgi:D-alanine--poly(phosphoribitol) ligase subunit 1
MKDLIEYIEFNCKNYPDRIAIIENDKKITYTDFYALYTKLSANLNLDNKAKPTIIFELRQSIEAYALIVAILNIGGTYCPLDLSSPLDRKEKIIDNFKPDLIIVEDNKNELSNYKNIKTHLLTDIIGLENDNPFDIEEYNDEDIVYTIYTSGSTGNPKGIMIPRKGLNKFLEWSIPTYGANENDIWGQFSSLSFDLSIVDIFTSLCSGSTLVVINDFKSKLFPSSSIEKYKITIWHSIPSAIDFMIEREETKSADFSSMRLFSFCGEKLFKRHCDFIFSKKNDVTIFNTYGPTEGTLFCSWQGLQFDNYDNYAKQTMSIGKEIPGWNFYLAELEDEESKNIFEIIIYGDFIGKGYIENNENSGFSKISIDGKEFNCFKTGDLVLRENNNLFFLTRKDYQVKIKGHRIELDEIDVWNHQFFGNTSVTIVHNNALISFIETKNEINQESVKLFLREKIESFKIPDKFIAVDNFPHNSNLKIDRKALVNYLK